MARSFDGSTDRIDWSNIWNPTGADVTISMWVKWDGGTSYGYMFNINDGGGAFGFIAGNPNDNSGDVRLFRKTGGVGYIRDTAGGVLVSGTWVHLVFTSISDFTSFTDIHIYKNGSEVSYSDGNSGGTEVSYTGTWSLGGRTSDNVRNFGGDIAEFGIWNEIASAGKIAALGKGFSPLFFPNNRKAYIPLIREYEDRVSGFVGTLDGTTVADHPYVIYPASQFVSHTDTSTTEQSWIEYVSRRTRFSGIRR